MRFALVVKLAVPLQALVGSTHAGQTSDSHDPRIQLSNKMGKDSTLLAALTDKLLDELFSTVLGTLNIEAADMAATILLPGHTVIKPCSYLRPGPTPRVDQQTARRISTFSLSDRGQAAANPSSIFLDRLRAAIVAATPKRSVRNVPNRSALIDHLRNSAYTRLAPSNVAGVGVFAMRDIPAGANPFAAPNPHLLGSETGVRLSASEILSLPSAVAEQVFDFHAAVDDPQNESKRLYNAQGDLLYDVCATGMVALDQSWFVNHGEIPNLEFVFLDNHNYNGFRTMRLVQAGEELLFDYRQSVPDLYERIASTTDRDKVAHREQLEERLRAAQSVVAQLRSELEALNAADK